MRDIKYTGDAQKDFYQLCQKVKFCGADKYLKGGK
jgi:hypothetical protein